MPTINVAKLFPALPTGEMKTLRGIPSPIKSERVKKIPAFGIFGPLALEKLNGSLGSVNGKSPFECSNKPVPSHSPALLPAQNQRNMIVEVTHFDPLPRTYPLQYDPISWDLDS